MKEWLRGKLAAFLGVPEMLQKLEFYEEEIPRLRERIEALESVNVVQGRSSERPKRVSGRTWHKTRGMLEQGVSDDAAS